MKHLSLLTTAILAATLVAAALFTFKTHKPELKPELKPEMVAIPSGSLILGSCKQQNCLSPPVDTEATSDDLPQSQARIAAFELGKTEVTVGQFAEFVRDTAYRSDAEKNIGEQGCRVWTETGWHWQAGLSWKNPGFLQNENHPVVCVSQSDAVTYTQWLSQKTGKNYRLPSEFEWEYAARGGKNSPRYWGNDPNTACSHANVADQSAKENLPNFTKKVIHLCTDNYIYTAPVERYAANAYQLHDMLGNVWEWTTQEEFVARGGGWLSSPQFARVTSRSHNPFEMRNVAIGFRVARTLP